MEKKLIAFSILAITIGVATIIPLQYLLTGQTEANAQPITPWFNVSIPYAYINLYDRGGNDTMTWDGAMFQAIANFTLTSDAINLKNADAQIEFYQFRLYSDNEASIVNITYSVAVCREEIDVQGTPGGYYMAITGSGGNKFTFADRTTYDGNTVVGDSVCGGGKVIANIPGRAVENYTVAIVGSHITNYNGNNAVQTLTELRNAQTLNIDVSKICSVAYQGNSSSTSATTTTLASDEILCHVALTKTENGFVYGTYTEGTVPFPIQTP